MILVTLSRGLAVLLSRRILLSVLLLVGAGSNPAWADFVSPGLGTVYSLDTLVGQSGGAVTGTAGTYEVHESVVISLGDRLDIAPGSRLTFLDATGTIGLEIHGGLRALGTAEEAIILTGSNLAPGSWRGLDFNNVNAGSEFHLTHVEIAYADIAVDVFDGDILLEDCDIHDCLDKAVDISSANGLIQRCHLHHNRQRTVTMTLTAAPTFEDCTLDHNNMDNTSPYPYFNVGLQGVNSPVIRGCLIDGSGNQMSGGMAFWASCQALVEDNTIQGCGYGLLCYSTGANPVIRDNNILDNNIHPDTVNWGFGVACNGNNAPVLAGNEISGHWYGVAAINGGQPNLGNLDNGLPGDDGGNFIHDNGLGGETYGFYNNTPLDQMAQFNDWGPVGAEDSIYHQVDDPALGLVTYEPVDNASAVEPVPGSRMVTSLSAHPNPFNPQVQISLTLTQDSEVSVRISDLAGRVVRQLAHGPMAAGSRTLVWDGKDQAGRACASGVFFYQVLAGPERQSGKLVLVR